MNDIKLPELPRKKKPHQNELDKMTSSDMPPKIDSTFSQRTIEKKLTTKQRGKALGEYFKEKLPSFLKGEQIDTGNINKHILNAVKKEINTPSAIITRTMAGNASLDNLSRILDAFPYNVPSYEEMRKIYLKPEGIKKYMQGILEYILPEVLNKNKTALNPSIIQAINSYNPKAYEQLKKSANDDQIFLAQQFIKAIFTSYGARLIDQYPDDKNDIRQIMNQSIGAEMERLALLNEKGMPKKAEMSWKILNKEMEQFRKLVQLANKAEIKNTSEGTIMKIDYLLEESKSTEEPLKNKQVRMQIIRELDDGIEKFIQATFAHKKNNIDKTSTPEEKKLFIKLEKFKKEFTDYHSPVIFSEKESKKNESAEKVKSDIPQNINTEKLILPELKKTKEEITPKDKLSALKLTNTETQRESKKISFKEIKNYFKSIRENEETNDQKEKPYKKI